MPSPQNLGTTTLLNHSMNFPDNQLTGVLSEAAVEQLFLSWRWMVGHDRLDIGYDLCVTPDRGKYKGARFLVQVKGTAKGGRRIVAQVEKARLRQYAEDALPVFIVRVTSDGHMLWVHAQAWTRANASRLSGSGSSGVRFDPSARLDDRATFESYLDSILRETINNAHTAEEMRFLNALDPRLAVRLEVKDGVREHQIFATSSEVHANLSFTPANTQANLLSIRDAIGFGLPRSVEVDGFRVTGSPLFDHIDASFSSRGSITIGSASAESGTVRVMPGHRYSMTAPQLTLQAELFRGQSGAAITNERKPDLFDLNIRIPRSPTGQMDFQIGLRAGALASRPIQSFDILRPIATWADQVAEQGSMYLELSFMGVRATATARGVDYLNRFLHFARTMSRLHLVAKALDSALTAPEELEMSAEEVDDINLAYALLRGERPFVKVAPIEFEPTEPIQGDGMGEIACTTTLELKVLGQVLGRVPVRIEFVGYVLEPGVTENKFRLVDKGQGKASVSYDEHGQNGISVRRASSGNEAAGSCE